MSLSCGREDRVGNGEEILTYVARFYTATNSDKLSDGIYSNPFSHREPGTPMDADNRLHCYSNPALERLIELPPHHCSRKRLSRTTACCKYPGPHATREGEDKLSIQGNMCKMRAARNTSMHSL